MHTICHSLVLLALPLTLVAQSVTTTPVTVDASKFATLQAAMDALPESGGVVTIPPGTYELTQPLVVKTAETRIQGAGASTHLVNKNEEGQPLMMIRPA